MKKNSAVGQTRRLESADRNIFSQYANYFGNQIIIRRAIYSLKVKNTNFNQTRCSCWPSLCWQINYKLLEDCLGSRESEKGAFDNFKVCLSAAWGHPAPHGRNGLAEKTVMLTSGELSLPLRAVGMDGHCQCWPWQLSTLIASVSHGPCPNSVTMQIISFLLTFWDCSQMISIGIFAVPKIRWVHI